MYLCFKQELYGRFQIYAEVVGMHCTLAFAYKYMFPREKSHWENKKIPYGFKSTLHADKRFFTRIPEERWEDTEAVLKIFYKRDTK